MNKRDTGFRKRACKKRTKQNCHLFWREMISKLPRQYTHMITRDTTYETIFFATKHSTWLLFVNTQLGLHHITCFKPYPPQSAEWTIWVQFLRCDAFLFLPLIVVSTRFTQLLWVIPAENGPNYAGITRWITYYSTGNMAVHRLHNYLCK